MALGLRDIVLEYSLTIRKPSSSTKTISLYTYNENLLPRGVLVRRRSSNSTSKEVDLAKEKSPKLFDSQDKNNLNEIRKEGEIKIGSGEEKIEEGSLDFENQRSTKPLDRRLSEETTRSNPEAGGSSSDLRPSENHETSPRKFPTRDEHNQLFIKSEV